MFNFNLTSILRRGSLLSAAVAAAAIPLVVGPAVAAEDTSAYTDGMERYAGKLFTEAITKLQEYLKKYPEGSKAPKAEFVMGGAYSQLKDWPNAAAALAHFLQRNQDEEDRPAAEYYLGEAYYHQVNNPKAIAAYNLFLKENKDPADRPYAEAHLGDSEYRMAEALNSGGGLEHYKAAAAAFRKVLDEPGLKTPAAAEADRAATVLSYATYWMGESLLQANDTAGAVQAFDTVIHLYPKSDWVADALLGKGVTLANSKDPNDLKSAAGILQDVAANHADPKKPGRTAEALNSLGVAQFSLKDYTAAAAAYQKLMDLKTSSYAADAVDGLAWSKYKLGQFAEAAPLFQQAAAKLTDKTQAAEAAYLGGYSYFKTGDVAKARAAWGPLLADSSMPHNLDARYTLARYQFDQKQWPAAIASFRSLAADYPNDPRAFNMYINMGDAAVNSKDFTNAADAYHHALPLAPHDLKPETRLALLNNLEIAYEQTHQDQQAAAMRAQIKQEFPNSAAALSSTLQESDAAYQAKEWKTALAGYETYLKDHSTDSNAGRVTYRAGYALLNLGRVPDAAVMFSHLSERKATPAQVADAMLGLSDAYLTAKKYQEAIDTYNKLIPIYTGSPKMDGVTKDLPLALYNRATAHASLQQWPDALADYSQVVRDHPKDPNAAAASYAMAWIMQKQGNREAAIAAYRKSIHDYPTGTNAPEASYRLGSLLAAAKNPEAATILSDVVTNYPDSPFAPRALLAQAVALAQQNPQNEAGAVALFGQIRTKYPKSQEAESATIGLAQLTVKKSPVEAGQLFDKFRTDYPHSKLIAHALYGSAIARFQQKKYADSATLFEQAANNAADVDLYQAPLWAGESYVKLGQYEQALPLYQRFLQNFNPDGTPVAKIPASPDDKSLAARANLGVGLSLLKQGSYDKSLPYLKQAQTLDDGGFGAPATLYQGEILLARHDFQGASDAFIKELTHTGYGNPALEAEAAYGWGQADEGLQQWASAKKAYERAAKVTDAGEWGTKATARIHAIETAHPG